MSTGFKKRGDIAGKRFNQLTVIEYAYTKNNKAFWLCRCDCGKEIYAPTCHLNSGHTKSCGCLKVETTRQRATKHGLKKSRLYSIWLNMKNRCQNPNSKSFKYYGKRGIKVCEEWNDFENFYKWAVNNGYEKSLTLDRIDVNGNYQPNNCRWADVKTQANNKRNSRYIEAYGEKHTVAEWAEKMQIKPTTLYSRLKKGCTNAELLRPVERRGAL